MDLKKPLDYDQQISKLEDHAICVDNSDVMRTKLREIGYYRLSGYALQFRLSENNSDCIAGTTASKVLQLYEFDRALRNILREYLEIAEVYARSIISYSFSTRNCTESPYNQHYDSKFFANEKGHKEVMNNFSRQRRYYNDHPIMKHHLSYYGGQLPLWAITEMISFSDLSKLYSSMKSIDQDSIAIEFRTGKALLRNNLHCLAVLRNKCAHAARLYNTVHNPPVRLNKMILRKYPDLKRDTLLGYIIALTYMLPDNQTRNRLKNSLLKIFKDYEDIIEFRYIGLFDNYKELLKEQ